MNSTIMNLITLSFLRGYRSKLMGGGMILWGLIEVIDGNTEGWKKVMEGLTVIFLREGMNNGSRTIQRR